MAIITAAEARTTDGTTGRITGRITRGTSLKTKTEMAEMVKITLKTASN